MKQDDKLVIQETPDGYVSKTTPKDVQAYLDQVSKQTHRIVSQLGEDPDPVLVSLVFDQARTMVQISMISRELDEHGIHPLEVEWESQQVPVFNNIADLFAALFSAPAGSPD